MTSADANTQPWPRTQCIIQLSGTGEECIHKYTRNNSEILNCKVSEHKQLMHGKMIKEAYPSTYSEVSGPLNSPPQLCTILGHLYLLGERQNVSKL